MAKARSVAEFYGANHEPKIKFVESKTPDGIEPFRSRILSGPDTTWKIFKRQAELLDFLRAKGVGLLPFVYQCKEGRHFLAAHPKVFWHYDAQRSPQNRCTYEIIREYSVCKLYFDLEFESAYNNNSDGIKMVNLFIRIVVYFIQKLWNIVCNKSDIVYLDSTTSSKFSCHLIFLLRGAIFLNNYHVGNFVKYLGHEIRNSLKNGCMTPDVKDSQFTLDELASLMVTDAKGSTKLFCDESVYSKNRHFRLYKSTKFGKNANLQLSQDNNFCPPASQDKELEIFLNSLITLTEHSEELNILRFDIPEPQADSVFVSGLLCQPRESDSQKVSSVASPFPEIDKFLEKIIFPGKIYRCVYFAVKCIVVFDIVGNRYCGNIKRQHKSNNIKYVFDLYKLHYYQKCYDPDCSNYKSENIPFPAELSFLFTDILSLLVDDNNIGHGEFSTMDSKLYDMLDDIENTALTKNQSSRQLVKFPSFGLSDEEMLSSYNDLNIQ